MVPYETALAKHCVNLAIAPALIECVFVGHHSTSIQFVTITNLLKITDLYKHPGVKFLRFHLPPKGREYSRLFFINFTTAIFLQSEYFPLHSLTK